MHRRDDTCEDDQSQDTAAESDNIDIFANRDLENAIALVNFMQLYVVL